MAKFEPVQNWLDNVAYSHSKSENTAYQYRHSFDIFCDFIEKTPQQILDEYDGMTDREFRRKYARYIRALISQLSQEYAIGTIKLIVAAIKSFFKYNDLPLGHVPTSTQKITFHNRDIAKPEIVEILRITSPRDRAFFCIMAQSGQRPSTLCNLKLKHIEPDFSKGTIPCKTEIPEELAKGEFGAYFTFIGEESVKHLRDYFKTRGKIGPEDYLFTFRGKETKLDRSSPTHIFRRAISRLKRKGIIDFKQAQKGKPSDLRLYNLRKWFRKQAGHAGVEYVNFWMGHRTDYKASHIPSSDEHYFSREDIEFHRQLYEEKAMPHLRLETATPSETEQTIMELRTQNDELQISLRNRQRALDELETRIADLEERSETLGWITEVLRDPDKMRRFKKLMLE